MSDTPANKQRLLIVDDSKVIRVTARKILQNHFETVEAVDGNNAWEVLSSDEPFSLVVSDLTMPGMDGFELLEKIRSSHLPHVNRIPVIIITGANDSESTKQRATDAGATDFIGKPFDAVHLLARTQAHADAYSTEQTLTQETMTLEDQALIDPSSGLPNEMAFTERGHQQLSYAVRHNSSLALFYIDIDNFGELFMKHGETATIEAVRDIAGVLNACIRQEDIAARTGTSRFALLLPGMNNDGIRNLAERIINDVNALQGSGNEGSVPLTVSIGVATPDINSETEFDSILATASGNQQQAASQGGNQVVYTTVPAEPDTVPDLPSLGETPLSAPTPDIIEIAADETISGAAIESFPDLELVGAEAESRDIPQTETISSSPFKDEVYEEDETIVITAPGDYYSEDCHVTAAASDTADSPADTAAQTDGQSEQSSSVSKPTTGETGNPSESKAGRRGIFSRFWSIFRRKH
jgi:diguanylate cyclase (GGDEF)-like protein